MWDPKVIPTPTQTRLPLLLTRYPLISSAPCPAGLVLGAGVQQITRN